MSPKKRRKGAPYRPLPIPHIVTTVAELRALDADEYPVGFDVDGGAWSVRHLASLDDGDAEWFLPLSVVSRAQVKP